MHFERVDDIAYADFIHIPSDYRIENYDYFREVHDRLPNGIPMLIMYNNDDAGSIDLPNALILRTSMYASAKKANEFSLPCWVHSVESFDTDESDQEIAYNQFPKISYCGYTLLPRKTLLSYGKRILDQLFAPLLSPIQIPGDILRNHVTNRLIESQELCSFIVRPQFWGHSAQSNKDRLQYFANMIENRYALLMKGGGNFSNRFYEAYAFGRIPIVINTELVLPFDWIIDYASIGIWAEWPEISMLRKEIERHIHDSTVDKIQREVSTVRSIYKEYLRIDGFMSKFNLIVDRFYQVRKVR